MEFVYGVVSDIGNHRKVNQDNYYIKLFEDREKNEALFLICDGMGGLTQGEIASLTVVKNFEKYFVPYMDRVRDKEKKVVIESLNKILRLANMQLIKYSKRKNLQLGTTASALLILDNQYYIAHVGDSRIYTIRDKITQLTEDHTYVAECVKKGEMTPEEANTSNKNHILSQCIGVLENIRIYNKVGKVKNGQVFILCSDGLYNTNEEEVLYNYVKDCGEINSENIQNCARKLVDKAMENGERDNITIEIISIKREENKKKHMDIDKTGEIEVIDAEEKEKKNFFKKLFASS